MGRGGDFAFHFVFVREKKCVNQVREQSTVRGKSTQRGAGRGWSV